MENTPKSQSFQCSSTESGYFDTSRSMFESTPNADKNNTPLLPISRKRKASFLENCSARKLADVIETCPLSPPFSSTFNDSLMNHLEKFHIETEESIDARKGYSVKQSPSELSHEYKLFKTGGYNKKIRSAPSTPEKQRRSYREAARKANTSSFVKNFSQVNLQSPLNKEAYGILYPDLPPLEPCRKPLTPQKFKENLIKPATPAKKFLFSSTPPRDLFTKIFTNTIIVENIFRNLSDGDLYRLSKVSQSLKDALSLDLHAYQRYRRYLHMHRSSKENYRITPPKSPQTEDSGVETSDVSRNFYYFCDIAKDLNKNQSLVKCPRCNRASVVENFIGQCQDINSCGYIFCQKCNSFANNPKDFKDKCNNAQLVNFRARSRLGDLSNSTVTSDYVSDMNSTFFSSPSFNLSPLNRHESTMLESNLVTPKGKVKRNLSKSFTSTTEVKPRALASNNNNRTSSCHSYKLQRRASLLPVMPMGGAAKVSEIIEPSSPPKVKAYSACSKQSKRNLKRLTR